MVCKNRMIVYPFNSQFSPVLRHKKLLDEYEIIKLISPAGWGMSGTDAGNIDGGSNIGVLVESDYNDYVELCDTVMFIESNYNIDFKKLIYPKIQKAIELKKDIIITMNVECPFIDEIRNKCCENGKYFKYYGSQKLELPDYNIITENIIKIQTPIIFVMGMAENLNKFEIQLSIGEKFAEAGYKVCQIGTRSYSNILGLYDFPQFMYDKRLTESRKIVMFNRFVNEIERKDKPEVIIIGIPGGVMPINNEFTNQFGILALEISMAVKPDSVVLSLPYENYSVDHYERIVNYIRNRFGFDVDVINLSNIALDWSKLSQGMEMSYLTLKSDFIDIKKKMDKEFRIPIVNIFNEEDCITLSSNIVNKLAQYGEIGLI